MKSFNSSFRLVGLGRYDFPSSDELGGIHLAIVELAWSLLTKVDIEHIRIHHFLVECFAYRYSFPHTNCLLTCIMK